MKVLLPLFRVSSLVTARLNSGQTALCSSRDPYSTTALIDDEMDDNDNKLATQQEASAFVQSLPPLAKDARRIVLMRHGETDWNHRGLLQGGGYDICLNAAGQEQARAAAAELQGLNMGVIASSHLERSEETANILAQQQPQSPVRVIHHKFGEMRFGEFEGTQIRQSNTMDNNDDAEAEAQRARLRQRFHDFNNIMHEHWHVAWPGGGESIEAVAARGQAGVHQLLRDFDDCDCVGIVAHGRFNKILLASLLGLTGSGSDVFQQGNACINVLDVTTATDGDYQFQAHVINHMEHIASDTAKQAPS